mmetsp:Transcript_49492/g.123052  ORF Transcript_49492/g.123052 Transcript_49492/m.123052 type:complete len:220 (+) Transcript_49492:103-762(+)
MVLGRVRGPCTIDANRRKNIPSLESSYGLGNSIMVLSIHEPENRWYAGGVRHCWRCLINRDQKEVLVSAHGSACAFKLGTRDERSLVRMTRILEVEPVASLVDASDKDVMAREAAPASGRPQLLRIHECDHQVLVSAQQVPDVRVAELSLRDAHPLGLRIREEQAHSPCIRGEGLGVEIRAAVGGHVHVARGGVVLTDDSVIRQKICQVNRPDGVGAQP